MIKVYKSEDLTAFDFKTLQKKISELFQLNCEIATMAFEKPIDSSDINPKHWVKIAALICKHYHIYNGHVVLYGSDTMSYTVFGLSFILENLEKLVILTGSQLPIGDLRTDAKDDLITAIQIASLQEK